MKHEILSRRDLLFKCALSAVPSLSLTESINRWEEQASGGTRTTAWDEIGAGRCEAIRRAVPSATRRTKS